VEVFISSKGLQLEREWTSTDLIDDRLSSLILESWPRFRPIAIGMDTGGTAMSPGSNGLNACLSPRPVRWRRSPGHGSGGRARGLGHPAQPALATGWCFFRRLRPTA